MAGVAAFLIVVMSAWSGQSTNVTEFPDMPTCREAVTEMKVAASSGNAIAAYCATRPPESFLEWPGNKEWRARFPLKTQ